MFFPINQDQGENSLETVKKSSSKFGKSLLFDFNKGDFVLYDGKIQLIEGEQALKIWVQKVLRTEKIKYKIYEIISNTYGVTLDQYFYSDYPTGVIYAGIQSSITEMLMNHPDINAVKSFEFTRDKKHLSVTFTLVTTFGEINEGVNI